MWWVFNILCLDAQYIHLLRAIQLKYQLSPRVEEAAASLTRSICKPHNLNTIAEGLEPQGTWAWTSSLKSNRWERSERSGSLSQCSQSAPSKVHWVCSTPKQTTYKFKFKCLFVHHINVFALHYFGTVLTQNACWSTEANASHSTYAFLVVTFRLAIWLISHVLQMQSSISVPKSSILWCSGSSLERELFYFQKVIFFFWLLFHMSDFTGLNTVLHT